MGLSVVSAVLAAASAAPFVTPMDTVGWGTVLGGGPVRHNSLPG